MPSALLLAAIGCASEPEELTRDEGTNPETCRECHPKHFREWQSSMHAYAAEDPIFRAMMRRGLRETDGALGDQCLACHAPMTVGDEGSDANEPSRRGVTCYACHALLGDDGIADEGHVVFAGGIATAAAGAPHGSRWSPSLDRRDDRSSALCGKCHGQTFDEWKASIFAGESTANLSTCGACHMAGADDRASTVAGGPTRRVHSHLFAGTGVALADWPDRERQRKVVKESLATAVHARLCVQNTFNGVMLEVSLENISVGHMWPTRSTLARRAWLELVAYDAADTIVFETGRVADNDSSSGRIFDVAMWSIANRAFDDEGREVSMPWKAHAYERELLPPSVTSDRKDPAFNHAVARIFEPGVDPERIELRVRVRPVDFDLIDDLEASGDLEPNSLSMIPTFDLQSTRIEWRRAQGMGCFAQ